MKREEHKHKKNNMMLEERNDCYTVLKKDENNDNETGVHKFTLALSNIKFNKTVSEINVEIYFSEWEPCSDVQILCFKTEKEHRKKGFATFLLNYLIGYARNKHHEKIYVRIDNIDADTRKIVEFYKNRGFEITRSGQVFHMVFPILQLRNQ